MSEISGFNFLGEATYSCGVVNNTVKEYTHLQTGMMFALIPGGSFMMGGDKYDDEKPIHKVTLKPFLISFI